MSEVPPPAPLLWRRVQQGRPLNGTYFYPVFSRRKDGIYVVAVTVDHGPLVYTVEFDCPCEARKECWHIRMLRNTIKEEL